MCNNSLKNDDYGMVVHAVVKIDQGLDLIF